MQKTVNVKSASPYANKQSLPVVFEGKIKDCDDFRFFVATTDNAALNGEVRKGQSFLIACGDDDYLNPEHGAFSPVFPVLAGENLKVKAAQLRELADWFDSQA